VGASRRCATPPERRTECIAAVWAASSSTARRTTSKARPASGSAPSVISRRPSQKPQDRRYVVFETAPNDLDIEVQKVDHPSRVHLDIETDDVEAEVKRLEALGARRVTALHDWVVMEAPTGHRFCVVPVERAGFAAEANVWE
jgi:hypothetical protein